MYSEGPSKPHHGKICHIPTHCVKMCCWRQEGRLAAGFSDFLGWANSYTNRIQIREALGEAGIFVKHLTGTQWSKDLSEMMFTSIWFPKKNQTKTCLVPAKIWITDCQSYCRMRLQRVIKAFSRWLGWHVPRLFINVKRSLQKETECGLKARERQMLRYYKTCFKGKYGSYYCHVLYWPQMNSYMEGMV